jgi:glycosyl transferase family 25
MIHTNKIILIVFIIIFIFLSSICSYKIYRINNTSNVFDKVYLMNLKRRPDRLKNFLNYYKNSDMKNIPLLKFDAIDGSKLEMSSIPLSELAIGELQQLESTGFRTKHYQLTKGGIGCYLSHVKIWENILKNNYETVLIFEDDAQVPKDILKSINEEIVYIPNDWDIILYGYVCSKCMKYEKYNEVERFMLTHCYLIKKSAIIKIMNSGTLFPISQQIDALLSELSSIINIYTVKDKLVKQFESRTDIQAPLINKTQRKLLDIDVNERNKVL